MSTETTPAVPNGNGRRKLALILLTALFTVAGIGYAVYYKQVLSQSEDTDDAYVSGNVIPLMSQVAGTVIAIGADETQRVNTGQELVKLDPTDAAVALKEAEAQLGETVRNIRQQFANIGQYTAQLEQRRIDLARAQDDYQRRAPLLQEADRAVSTEDVDHARKAVESATQQLKVTEQQLNAARAGVEGVSLKEHPSVLKARAALEQAYIASQRNAILAPLNGYVAKRAVQVGSRISPGTPLLSIVPLDALWVDANFKEPQLRNIRIGQPVILSSDLYGDSVEFHGRVLGLGAGTGSAFALLPAQNATGNWIKVVQRVPVRIGLDPKELAAHPLRIGLSTLVTIDTHDRSGQVLAAVPATQPTSSTDVYAQPLKEAGAIADRIIAKNAGSQP